MVRRTQWKVALSVKNAGRWKFSHVNAELALEPWTQNFIQWKSIKRSLKNQGFSCAHFINIQFGKKITHLNFRAKLHNYFFWEFKKCSQRCKLRHVLVIFTQWRKCMTIDNFSNIVHFLREKPHYFLLPYCIVVIKDHFFKVKIGMIDMGGLFCLLSKIKSSMKDTSKNLLLLWMKLLSNAKSVMDLNTFWPL